MLGGWRQASQAYNRLQVVIASGINDQRRRKVKAGGTRGHSRASLDANVAQSVEQRFRKARVVGSSPIAGSNF